jgi:HK97 gp10 family phage protein
MARSFNNWNKAAEALRPAVKAVVKKTAFDIQAQAQSRAPVDTGFLRNSVYTQTSDSSSYRGGEKALPEIAGPSSETEAYVAVGAEYGVYVELGTSRQSAQPYFYPAIEAIRPGFDKAMEAIKKKMEGAARE